MKYLNDDNELIAEFMGLEKKENCADWSKYDHLGITDAIKDFVGTTIKLDSPKGSGFKWFVVKHRDVYTQIYTDGTWNAVNPNDIDIVYDNVLIKDLAYHKSWDALMPVIHKLWESAAPAYERHNAAITISMVNHMKKGSIEQCHRDVVGLIKWWNTNKKL